MPEIKTDKAVEMAKALRYQIENLAIPHRYSAASDVVTISLGVASAIPQQDLSSASLIDKADQALYHAKQNGRNQVVAYEQIVV